MARCRHLRFTWFAARTLLFLMNPKSLVAQGISREDQCTLVEDASRQQHSLLQSASRAIAGAKLPQTKSLVESNKGVHERSFIELGRSVTMDSVADLMQEKIMSVIFGNLSIGEIAGDEICGTRALLPQLQLELEAYRTLGLVEAKYARCRVPSIRSVTMRMPMGGSITSGADALYTVFDHLTQPKYHELIERRALAAETTAVIFCALVMLSFFGIASSLRAEPLRRANDETQAKEDGQMLRLAWMRGSSNWLGMDLDWLEPVIKRYGWGTATMPKSRVQEKIEDGTASQYEAYASLREAWLEEVAQHGLENANLMRTVRKFLGAGVAGWLLFCAGMAAFLELAAMTVVLDMLLNYLYLARAAREANPDISLDLLRPTLMFICLGFGVPMAARLFRNMLALSDTYHANRIAAGLLTLVYEKSQHLPVYQDSERRKIERGDLIQLVTNDVRRMWSGTLSAYANLVVQPLCMVVLVLFLIQHLGRAALFGVGSTVWIGFVYIPIQRHVSLGHLRWGQLANSRLNLIKEAMRNIHTIKATVWDRPLSERIYTLREAELQTKFKFALVQSLLDVPFSIFPFALMVASLFFCCILRGKAQPHEIFACMQALSGLLYCSPSINASLQKSVSVPNAAKRIESFLQEPEKDIKSTQGNQERISSGNVRVFGNFAVAEGQPPMLRDMDFVARRGELVAIVGEVSSGKSALLAAIMGELPGADTEAAVEAPKDAIFCSQVPWIVDGTLQDNVTLDENRDQDRLYDALNSASLLKDNIIPDDKAEKKHTTQIAQKVDAATTDTTRSEEEEEQAAANAFPYFGVWNVCAVLIFMFSIINVDWAHTRPALGLLIAAVQGLLHWSVLEFPIQTVATLMTPTRKLGKADFGNLTVALNYNLLATSQADVDECMHNMLEAYMNNFNENVSAVLVSATNDPNLQQYELQVRNDHRARIYKELFRSGLAWAGFVEGGEVKAEWKDHVWSKYDSMDKNEFVQKHLNKICERYAREYMVLHRHSRVLRKCGQYQDLILLSSGEDKAFTYCDAELYGRAARKMGEPLFHASEDTKNVNGRHFDYTLVLDSDTRVEPGSVFKVLEVAAAYPDKAIVQPAIKMDCGPEDSIFMHLEAMRQKVYEPMNNTMTTLLGKSSFFGKGLIKNSAYARYCLGTRENLIESVPIDVLSHDTFEAAVTNPLYLPSVYLLEAPCHNYITWDIRERRWNLGELLLAGYFWPNGVGKPVQWMQSLFQGQRFNHIEVRTKTKLDRVSSYFAHSALRQMVLKPMLLAYIVVMHFVTLRYRWTPFIAVMFSIIVFPKLATCTRYNYKDVLLETGASILQFTPEAIVGTIRVLSAVKAHMAGAATWVPQRSVEEESKVSNPFLFSLRYLWYYSAFALVWGLRVGVWANTVGPEAMFIVSILGTLFMLPLYVGFTSLPANSLKQLTSGKFKEPEAKEVQEGNIADTTDAALQALRVRLPKMRLRQLQANGGNLMGNIVQRNGASATVACAADIIVGSRGARLSQAEKTCLALARAAYSKKSSLVLIDDPFALLDVQTGMHILQKLIKGPIMQGRTRIVTMQPYLDYLQHFDRIVLLQEGRVVLQGPASEVVGAREFLALMAKNAQDTSLEPLQVSKTAVTSSVGEFPLRISDRGMERSSLPEVQGTPQWTRIWNSLPTYKNSMLTLALLSVACLRLVAQGHIILLGRWADQAMKLEHVGGGYHVMMMVAVVLVSILQVAQGYAILTFSNDASRGIFRDAFSKILKAPASFWESQPVGRLLGRLSTDMNTVDMALSHGCVGLAGVGVDLLVQQACCFIVMPAWFMLPTYVIVFAFSRFFWNTSVHLQVLSALALSRCQEEHTQDSDSRLSIHAFHYEGKLVSQYCARAGFVVNPDSLTSHAKVWVTSRITFCLCFQSTVCVLVGILQPEAIGIGSLALLMVATFHIVQQLGNAVDCVIIVISLAVSLQRLTDLCDVPQDAPDQLNGDEQKRHRLVADGIGVRIEGLRAGLDSSGLDVITNINIDIQAKTKTVIVGLQGSGKTSLLNSIVRLFEPRAGRVLFNGTDTRNLGLLTLRSMICLVPQEPAIFHGTIRFNIDPFGQYPDERIWAAIQCAQLLPTIQRLQKGLNHVMTDDGRNLSLGQRQLLSLARAVCQQPPLLLLDECCSALDPRTYEAVQDTIMLNFPNSTIISTTRHMDEISNFNHIVVLEKGTIVRQGPTGRLMESIAASRVTEASKHVASSSKQVT